MSCYYKIHYKNKKISKELSHKDLVLKYREGFRDFKGIVYSKELDLTYNKIDKLKSEYYDKIEVSEDNIDFGEPNYTFDDKYTPQTFVNSGDFVFRTTPIIFRLNNEDYITNITNDYLNLGLTLELANIKAKQDVENWELINKDFKDLHLKLNSFGIFGDIEDFRYHIKDTKFKSVSEQLYDAIKTLIRPMLYGSYKYTDESSKLVLGVNLLATLNIGKDIIGHIDNVVIDTDGVVHIYNYKMSTTPPSSWSKAKRDSYIYQMALVKQILAYLGIDVSKVTSHFIPILVKYSDDYKSVEKIIVHDLIQVEFLPGYNDAETAAKYFIKSNIVLNPITSNTVQRINNNLNFFFPERGINVLGILKTAEEWIKRNYNSKWQDRIKKVNADDHVYELFFDDEYSEPIFITDPSDPSINPEIKEEVTRYLKEKSKDTNSFLLHIVESIRVGKRRGFLNLSKISTKSQKTARAFSFIEESLSKYINSYTLVDDKKIYDWDLICDDTLLSANILLFKNKYGQVDVVTLTNYNIHSSSYFKGLKNIMGSHIRDTKAGLLYKYKSNFGNIEALKTMTILNEVIPQLNDSNLRLGELKIISTESNGDMLMYDILTLQKELFKEAITVVKNNHKDFKILNNFAKSKFIDPIDLLTQNYFKVIESTQLLPGEMEDIKNLGIEGLDNMKTRALKVVELLAIILNIFNLDSTIASASEEEIINLSRNSANKQRKILAKLYILALKANLYYNNVPVKVEERISKIEENMMTPDMISNPTFRVIVEHYRRAADDIAYQCKLEYNHIYNFTMDFYKNSGFSSTRNSLIGDLNRAFDNLYRRDDKTNKILMEFRNPYSNDDGQTPLTNAEKVYLKKVLFELAKIRSEIYGFDFNFSSHEDSKLLEFINKNKLWYFNVPLERASKATVRSRGFENIIDDWKIKFKELISDPQGYATRLINKVGTPEETATLNEGFIGLNLTNPYINGDGYKEGERFRKKMISDHQEGYFETNVENILSNYLEKHILTKEFKKTLVTLKAIILDLTLKKGMVGDSSLAGIDLTIRMSRDYAKINIFNVSIMEPETQKVMAWLEPFRRMVSKAYIAGNITGMFRDTFEGVWQNMARAITKYKADINTKDVLSASKEVVKAAFTNVRTLTIIDELCKTYRLSNMDVARISEGLTTSRAGVLNIDNWLYSTMKIPDYLNRLTLFVARCMTDGCWEAFSIKDGILVYDWKKDKRYSIYADPSKKGTKEYKEQKIAYFNAIRKYNEEHPNKALELTDDLPVAYSNEDMEIIRKTAESIYGSYDKSMKAKYEFTGIGLCLGMFSTWMNAAASNYFAKPDLYRNGIMDLVQDTDESGNLLFIDDNYREIIKIEGEDGATYVYRDTGELITNIELLIPVNKKVPRLTAGIWYTMTQGLLALAKLDDTGKYIGFSEFVDNIWKDEIHNKNLRKLILDLIMGSLFVALFKFLFSTAYSEYKKDMINHTAIENALIEVLYKSSSASYDGFLGPLTIVQYLGENTNPPFYKLSTKIVTDLGKVAWGDKTWGLMFTGITALRSFKDTYTAEVKKDKLNNN